MINHINQYLQQFDFLNISIITYYEVLNGLYYKDAKKQLNIFMQFTSFNKIIPLTKTSATIAANITADLKKTGKFIGHNDVLIASIAIENDLVLITNNSNHFSRIKNLEIDNWAIA